MGFLSFCRLLLLVFIFLLPMSFQCAWQENSKVNFCFLFISLMFAVLSVGSVHKFDYFLLVKGRGDMRCWNFLMVCDLKIPENILKVVRELCDNCATTVRNCEKCCARIVRKLCENCARIVTMNRP